MRKVRWGILSTAKIAQNELIPAIQRAGNAEVLAIATGSNVDKAKDIADKFQIEKVYDSYEKLLNDPDIDAVYIPLPNHLHKKWTIEAARAKKHVLCEKPAALTAEDALEMKKVCEEEKVLFMEGFMYYFHPQHERVKELIAAGEIGDVAFMRASFSFPLANRENNIKMSKEKGGGSLYDVGCYGIHSIRNILGMEPESVYVHAVQDETFSVDTDVVGYVTFPQNIRAVFDASFNMAKRAEYEVVGRKGRILVPRAFRPDWHSGDAKIVVEKEGETREISVQGDQYRNEVEYFSGAVLEGKSLIDVKHSFENTIKNLQVIDACFQSIITQEKIYM